jgi:hypothetical protein
VILASLGADFSALAACWFPLPRDS